MGITEDVRAFQPGDPCPNVVDWGDGEKPCGGTLSETGMWRGEVLLPGEPVYDGPDVWVWWTDCERCGWDETVGGVP